MALNFPNCSRSYDTTKQRIRFWGYDDALEISFFIEDAALDQLAPAMRRDEAGCLESFDINRTRILEVASQRYSRRRGPAHILVASDF
jgi:hypothetical protein